MGRHGVHEGKSQQNSQAEMQGEPKGVKARQKPKDPSWFIAKPVKDGLPAEATTNREKKHTNAIKGRPP